MPLYQRHLVAGGLMFSALSVCPPYSCEHDDQEPPRANFFKFGTNVHLDSSMN